MSAADKYLAAYKAAMRRAHLANLRGSFGAAYVAEQAALRHQAKYERATRKNPPSRRMVAKALLRARQFSQGRRKWPDRGAWPSAGAAELERINRVLKKLARRRIAKKAWSASGHKMRTPESVMRDAMRYEDKLRGFAPRTNPLLQVVMPNRRKRRNPAIRGYAGRNGSRVRGGQRISRVGFVSPTEARTYPGFAKALETYRKFHGRAPTHFTRVRLEDGDKHVSRRAVVMIGEAPAIEYRTWRYANSTKSHTKDGRRITWRHKMGELGGKPAYYVHDPVSGVTSLLGGTYKVAGRPAFYHH